MPTTHESAARPTPIVDLIDACDEDFDRLDYAVKARGRDYYNNSGFPAVKVALVAGWFRGW